MRRGSSACCDQPQNQIAMAASHAATPSVSNRPAAVRVQDSGREAQARDERGGQAIDVGGGRSDLGQRLAGAGGFPGDREPGEEAGGESRGGPGRELAPRHRPAGRGQEKRAGDSECRRPSRPRAERGIDVARASTGAAGGFDVLSKCVFMITRRRRAVKSLETSKRQASSVARPSFAHREKEEACRSASCRHSF